jgi:hypothetical protein
MLEATISLEILNQDKAPQLNMAVSWLTRLDSELRAGTRRLIGNWFTTPIVRQTPESNCAIHVQHNPIPCHGCPEFGGKVRDGPSDFALTGVEQAETE